MRNTTMVTMSAAAAAAAAALSGDAASASTPDWLTLVTVESGHESLVPVLCETGQADSLAQIACGSLLSADTEGGAEAYGWEVPESPETPGMPAVATVDLRNFAKWQICGNNVAGYHQASECDNSMADPRDPVESSSGIALVNADTTGAFR
jgi:hypothetical protein